MRQQALFLVGMAAILAGCSTGLDDTANGGLVNTSWTVISISGLATAADARPTMSFAGEGTVSGSGGCNRFTGSFRTDGDRIAVGQVSSTLMGCDGLRGQQEAAFLAALQGATNWRLGEDGNLVIGGAGEVVARPAAAEGPPADEPPADQPLSDLAGTSWILTDMGGTADFAHLVPTLEFREDGSVSGFAGCNTFQGSYTLAGDALTLGPLTTTRIGCQRPASAVEADYLAALAGNATWSTDDAGRLVLGGTVPLTFARS